MKHNRLALGILCIGASLHAQKFSDPKMVVPVDQAFFDGGPHTTVPKWDHGFLLKFDLDAATVFAADRNGKLVFRSRIWPEGAVGVHIVDVTASPKGGYVVALGLINSAGPVGALAWLDSRGALMRVVQAPSTRFVRARFAGDGTLWALVQQRDEMEREAKNYDMLRHYDANGALMGTALPRAQFASARYPAEPGTLVASADRIGVSVEQNHAWIELSYSGQILGHWKMPSEGFDETTSAFLTDVNEVYVRYQLSQRTSTGKQQVGVYRFDKATETFQKIDTSFATSGVVGVDGDALVATKSFNNPTLLWVTPQ
jgi:hypothetical protein